MGGVRQHYIPRFLLRGFASKVSNEKVFVWYLRKGEEPIEVSTKDIALEKYFYGEPGQDSLDKTITERENDFAKVVDKARGETELSDEDNKILIQIVQDIIIRTRHVRKGLTEGADKLYNMFLNNIADKEKVTTLFKNKNVKDQVRRAIEKKLNTNDPKIINPFIQSLENDPHLLAELGQLFSEILKKIDLTKEMESAHKKGITRVYDEGSTTRLEEYSKLIWTVKCFEQKVLILGDVGVIKLNTKTGEFSLPITSMREKEVILLPISHNKLLVGSFNEDISLPSVDTINKAMAELSMDFIISAWDGEKVQEYSQLIGDRADYLDDQTLHELESEHFKKK